MAWRFANALVAPFIPLSEVRTIVCSAWNGWDGEKISVFVLHKFVLSIVCTDASCFSSWAYSSVGCGVRSDTTLDCSFPPSPIALYVYVVVALLHSIPISPCCLRAPHKNPPEKLQFQLHTIYD